MAEQTLIIGAGIYGISIANCLFQQKSPFVIVGRPFDMWKNHTFNSMTLRSDFPMSEIYHPASRYSCQNFFLEHDKYSRLIHQHLPVAVFRKYLEWVEKKLEFSIIKEEVQNLESGENGDFIATLRSGESIHSKKVIVATGVSSHQNIPRELRRSDIKIFHSYEARQIQKISNSKVLVIGSGQSAGESIEILLENANHVEWFGRFRPVYFEQPVNIPAWLFMVILKSMKYIRTMPATLRKYVNSYLSRPTVMPGFEKIFQNVYRHTQMPDLKHFNQIIAATGYRENLDNLAFFSNEIKNSIKTLDNIPAVNKSFESNLAGLYFTGSITSSFFGPSVKFIAGAHFAAPIIAKDIFRKTGY
ncbi:MAG: NAD(P)-binding domain-containing protein [Spirochaetia bacterium]|nr:NAD(P)-binding domain-containing protein [Spirochaetia bacterium]